MRPLFSQSLLACLPFFPATSTAADYSFFDGEVLPILESRCFECHGGKDKLRGNLRLTSREGLLTGGDLGPALDPDQPGQSFFLKAIRYEDEDHQMPPKGKLPAPELDVLTRWIHLGAPYNPQHEIVGPPPQSRHLIREEDFSYWAYRPVSRPPVPTASGGAHPIDAFLAAHRGEIPLNPPASRETLVRRAYYGLLGLPPSPAEIEAFTNDPRPDPEAWKALIENLLARPQYGEKWARHWLDLVRYAETNGFERDNPKPHIWQYRDYVVRSFNEDKPYDRFILEQLAGDELEQPTFNSLAATGFHRLMQWDDEPADRQQHVYDVLADIVAVTAETFLGSTLGCARCHDHKVDPFTQRDYYAFMAFFHGVTPYRTEGTLTAWSTPEERDAFEARRQREMDSHQQDLAALEDRLRRWLEERNLLALASPASPPLTLVDRADGKSAAWDYTFSTPPPDWHSPGFRDKNWPRTERGGFGTKGTPGAVVHNEWSTPEIWLRTTFGLRELPDSLYLEIHHDEDVEVYLNGVEIFRATGHLIDYETVPLGRDALDALQTGQNSLAIHCRQTRGGQFIDLALRSHSPLLASLDEALKRGGKDLAARLRNDLGEDLIAARQTLRTGIAGWRARSPGILLNAVSESGPRPPDLHLHIRGSAHAPGDKVNPGLPAVLRGRFDPEPVAVPASYTSESSSGRRRVLAEWIASPENPLTARVMTNRIWQHHFGRGLAPSSSDFGKLGEPPTHPELLDWLAAEFVARSWSLKAMHRLLMTSQAFQLSSASHPAASSADPDNILLWRTHPRRLTAEELRDSLLLAAGTLHLPPGGPWVTPPLPDAVLATASRPGKSWPATTGPDAHRRSLYVHVKRSLREPLLASHDQADTDGPCAVRFVTTVPTQALGMMNSSFTHDQARALASRLRSLSPVLEEQIQHGFRLTLQRPPSPDEVREVTTMLQRLQVSGLSPDQALERFALLTLNLNEFIYLD